MKHRLLAITVCLVLLLSIIAVPAQAAGDEDRTYTVNSDFDEGTLAGVEHDSVPDQLQLSDEQTTLPFIWVANSNESTVSKIDTRTGEELGRYRTGPGTGATENPSRTTVDANGDVWVGNRNSATAVKIALNPEDTTGGELSRPNIFAPADSVPDGILNTSYDANNNGVIDPSEVLPWGEDDAVIMRISVASGPRALAVDSANNVWIGGTGYLHMGYYDGQTGDKIKDIAVNRQCYGALIDGDGTLWVSNASQGSITKITDPSGTHNMTFIATGNGWVYGLGINSEGYIYTSAYTNQRLRKLDPDTNTWVFVYTHSQLYGGRGVCVGLDGDVWVADSSRGTVSRHDPDDGTLLATINVGNTPTGVAVDEAGKIWVTNYGSNSIMRIDPATNSVELTKTGHTGPYNYSDMTGIIARNITTKVGTWTVVHDSSAADTAWNSVSWTADTPENTSITIKVRSSNDQAAWSDWEEAGNGTALAATPAGRYLEIETTLKITSGDVSPALYDLSVDSTPANTPPAANAGLDQEVEADLTGGANVNLDGSASTDDGNLEPLTYTWTWDGGEATGVIPTVELPQGTTVITLEVFDGQFSDTDEVSITVTDTIPPELLGQCVESTNPHGNNVPGKNRDKNGKGDEKNTNPDGFYLLDFEVVDTCDPNPTLWVGTADNPQMFQVEPGMTVKFTESIEEEPVMKPIGSPAQGGATAVTWHIILPSDPVISAVDASGNIFSCTSCVVPPKPM